MKKTFALLLLPLMATAPQANEDSDTGRVDHRNIPVCYNYGCKVKETVTLRDEEWAEVVGWFNVPASTPADERAQVQQAIGWMEVVVGRHVPTFRDVGLNQATTSEWPGQLDCIDESLNTTTYLKVLENAGVLRHHRVVERARRIALLDQHFSGQLEEIESGDRFVIDSWFYDNGRLPVVQATNDWLDIPIFTSYVDNSD